MGNDMSLPEEKTCKDCYWFIRCSALFMCDPGSDSCDFAPSRFKSDDCNHLYRAIDQTRSQCAKCGEIK